MANTGAPIEVLGLTAWVSALKGPAFRQVNEALRGEAMRIATTLIPEVEKAISLSSAPQAPAMKGTVRARRDRVPVLSIGATNPKFRNRQGRKPPFTRSGSGALAAKLRRGAIAHGIVYGTKGGHPRGGGDYYQIPRDESGGPVGRYISRGAAFDKAADAYFEAYRRVLAEQGITLRKGRLAA